ncbi:hypothetical protein CSC94_23445 [Zhengella mangrovi]|uniref:Insertion element IS402-like domain-containing protein n=1 Tax=Zhengella mangrovi TaxID=1982044 RepID=A0A2G1QGN3_9HYPH|nr:hypothetical protein CSC94_23445 [Zhengella mangrovi]
MIQPLAWRCPMSRYDLTEFEWRVIAPLLPNKPQGVPRVDERCVLKGIFWGLRSGSPWRDLPERYGPHTTCYNRFRRWTKADVWDRIMDAITEAYGGDARMIDGTSVRAHHSAATLKKPPGSMSWTKPGWSYCENPCFDRRRRTAGQAHHFAGASAQHPDSRRTAGRDRPSSPWLSALASGYACAIVNPQLSLCPLPI